MPSSKRWSGVGGKRAPGAAGLERAMGTKHKNEKQKTKRPRFLMKARLHTLAVAAAQTPGVSAFVTLSRAKQNPGGLFTGERASLATSIGSYQTPRVSAYCSVESGKVKPRGSLHRGRVRLAAPIDVYISEFQRSVP